MTTASTVRSLHSSEMLNIDAARQEAERAAALLLKSLVLTVLRTCRFDLTATQRERFCHRALRTHRRGIQILQHPSVNKCFNVDVDLLRDRSIGVATRQMRHEFTDAREFGRHAIVDAIVPTYPVSRHRTPTAIKTRHSVLSAAAPLAA